MARDYLKLKNGYTLIILTEAQLKEVKDAVELAKVALLPTANGQSVNALFKASRIINQALEEKNENAE